MFDFAAFKEYLENRGIKQTFVAQQIGISIANLNAILTGRQKCSLEQYVSLCHLFELPFGKFLALGGKTAQATE